MRLVYNPGGKELKIVIDDEKIVIPPKGYAEMKDGIAKQLSEILPGLEYPEKGFEPSKPEPKKKVEKKRVKAEENKPEKPKKAKKKK